MMQERKLTEQWGMSISYDAFKALVDQFEKERFGDEATIEFVQVIYIPGGETGASRSGITFVSRKTSE